MLIERNRTEKDKYCNDVTYIWNLKNNQTPRKWEVVLMGEGGWKVQTSSYKFWGDLILLCCIFASC